MGVVMITAAALGAAGQAGAQHTETEHHHGHYESSSGGVDHWLPRLEGEGRDGWQRPDHVVELLSIEPGMTVVDLGAGTGYFLAYLAAAVGPEGQAVGLDVDEELVDFMVERIRREAWANASARRVAFDDPGLTAASVDRILIVNTWHHIADRLPYSRRLAEALRPGGAVYVVDFTAESPHGPPVDHRLKPSRVMEELGSADLDVEVADEDLPYQYVVVGKRRQ